MELPCIVTDINGSREIIVDGKNGVIIPSKDVDALHKAMKAMRRTGHKVLAVSGGVSCNSALRRQLEERCRRARIQLILPPNSLTTDNAAMIAFAGLLHAREGEFSPLNTPVDPNMKLAGAQARV